MFLPCISQGQAGRAGSQGSGLVVDPPGIQTNSRSNWKKKKRVAFREWFYCSFVLRWCDPPLLVLGKIMSWPGQLTLSLSLSCSSEPVCLALSLPVFCSYDHWRRFTFPAGFLMKLIIGKSCFWEWINFTWDIKKYDILLLTNKYRLGKRKGRLFFFSLNLIIFFI